MLLYIRVPAGCSCLERRSDIGTVGGRAHVMPCHVMSVYVSNTPASRIKNEDEESLIGELARQSRQSLHHNGPSLSLSSETRDMDSKLEPTFWYLVYHRFSSFFAVCLRLCSHVFAAAMLSYDMAVAATLTKQNMAGSPVCAIGYVVRSIRHALNYVGIMGLLRITKMLYSVYMSDVLLIHVCTTVCK